VVYLFLRHKGSQTQGEEHMKAEELKDEFHKYFDKPVTTWKERPVMVNAKAGGLTLISFWVRDEDVTEQAHNFNKEKNNV
jgi:hypothetical protein